VPEDQQTIESEWVTGQSGTQLSFCSESSLVRDWGVGFDWARAPLKHLVFAFRQLRLAHFRRRHEEQLNFLWSSLLCVTPQSTSLSGASACQLPIHDFTGLGPNQRAGKQAVPCTLQKINWVRLQLALPWFTPRDSRSGLQVETNPLAYGHLPSHNLAEDALERNFFCDRVQIVSH
jgi:hypothetical protein